MFSRKLQVNLEENQNLCKLEIHLETKEFYNQKLVSYFSFILKTKILQLLFILREKVPKFTWNKWKLVQSRKHFLVSFIFKAFSSQKADKVRQFPRILHLNQST